MRQDGKELGRQFCFKVQDHDNFSDGSVNLRTFFHLLSLFFLCIFFYYFSTYLHYFCTFYLLSLTTFSLSIVRLHFMWVAVALRWFVALYAVCVCVFARVARVSSLRALAAAAVPVAATPAACYSSLLCYTCLYLFSPDILYLLLLLPTTTCHIGSSSLLFVPRLPAATTYRARHTCSSTISTITTYYLPPTTLRLPSPPPRTHRLPAHPISTHTVTYLHLLQRTGSFTSHVCALPTCYHFRRCCCCSWSDLCARYRYVTGTPTRQLTFAYCVCACVACCCCG